jgi:hypothetical protein
MRGRNLDKAIVRHLTLLDSIKILSQAGMPVRFQNKFFWMGRCAVRAPTHRLRMRIPEPEPPWTTRTEEKVRTNTGKARAACHWGSDLQPEVQTSPSALNYDRIRLFSPFMAAGSLKYHQHRQQTKTTKYKQL